MKTCSGCKHKNKLPVAVLSKIQLEFCLRYPPTAHLVTVQDKLGQQIGTQNTYPSVNDQTPACGEYSEAEKAVLNNPLSR